MIDFRIANIKPDAIDETGIVTFTDGTNTGLSANQETCEAYGYTYDNRSGTCRLNQQFEASLGRAFNRQTNKVMGSGNVIETGVSNSVICGDFNKVGGRSRNPLIAGTENKIDPNIQNAVVFGVHGKAQRQSEFVIGGGVASGINQTSIVQLGGTTEDATATKLTIQSDGSSWIAVQNNSIFAFESKVIVLCAGGTSGRAGDYAYLELTGAIQVDDGYNLVISQASSTIASIGSTGTAQVISAGVDPYITIEVTGAANIDLEWFASVKITEKKLIEATF